QQRTTYRHAPERLAPTLAARTVASGTVPPFLEAAMSARGARLVSATPSGPLASAPRRLQLTGSREKVPAPARTVGVSIPSCIPRRRLLQLSQGSRCLVRCRQRGP